MSKDGCRVETYFCGECGTEMVDYQIDYLCPKCPTFTHPDYVWTDERRLEHKRIELSVLEQSYKSYLKIQAEIEALEKKIENNRSGAV
jgi:hypothetical protein